MKKDFHSLWPLGVGLMAAGMLVYEVLPTKPSSSPTQTAAAKQDVNAVAQNGVVSKQIVSSTLDAVLAETDPVRRKAMMAEWAQSVGLAAMQEMLEGTQSIADDGLRNQASAALLTSWGERDLPGAVDWFSNHPGGSSLHQQARDLLAQDMAGRSPVEMVSWMEQSLPESSRRELYGPFFREWTATDPAAAATLLGKLSSSSGTAEAANPEWTDLTGQVAAQWANADLNSAVNWAQALPSGAAKMLALKQVSYKWAETNPQAAAAYAAKENDLQLLDTVAAKWAEKDPQAVATWTQGLPAGKIQDSAIAAMATAWASKDPAAAATYASSLAQGAAQTVVAMTVVSTWAYDSPSQAAQWIEQFPEGSLRQQALKTLVPTWAGTHMDQASHWLQNLPQTPSRDVAVITFSNTLITSAPETAFNSAQTISNESLRNDQLQTVAVTWLQNDPAAARAAIAQSSLPKNLKSKLLPPAN